MNKNKRAIKPVKTSERVSFGIAYFSSESAANEYSEQVVKSGATYNGGFFHGMACGRAREFDYTDETHGKLYAVTH
jgi:hypothetical protein